MPSDLIPAPHAQAQKYPSGHPQVSKLGIARTIVKMGFEELREKLPQNPPHPVLGFHPRDKYWLHMFDALAVAVAAQASVATEVIAVDRTRGDRLHVEN
jgi:hypothetical protein